jgi:membrane fusion protein (multidrug efflux system)
VGLPVRINEAAGGPQGEATIAAIDPTVDEVTRSIKVRAAIPKAKDNTLRPGMYVTVSVVLPEKRRIVIVPGTAVVHAAFGDSVFIIEDRKDESGAVVKGPDGKPAKVARQQFVKTDERRGDFVSITDGVKAGQEVVVSGAFKLRNGAPVTINNSVKPEPKLAPTPENR